MAKGTFKDGNISDDEESESRHKKEKEIHKRRTVASESEVETKSFSEDESEKHNHIHEHKHKHRHKRSADEEEEADDDNAKESESGDDTVDKKRKESADFVELEILEDDADEVDSKQAKRRSNTYAAKKTVAQGMMDIALITANANQLRYLIEFNRHSSTFYVNVILIVLSLILQVGVGISLIFKGRMDLRGQSKHRHAKRINNYVVVGVFLVTLINVFVASFTVTGQAAQGEVPAKS